MERIKVSIGFGDEVTFEKDGALTGEEAKAILIKKYKMKLINAAAYATLTEDEKKKLKDFEALFQRKSNWSGAKGGAATNAAKKVMLPNLNQEFLGATAYWPLKEQFTAEFGMKNYQEDGMWKSFIYDNHPKFKQAMAIYNGLKPASDDTSSGEETSDAAGDFSSYEF